MSDIASTGSVYMHKVEACQKSVNNMCSSVGENIVEFCSTLGDPDLPSEEIQTVLSDEVEFLQGIKAKLLEIRSDVELFRSYQSLLLGSCHYFQEKLLSLSKLKHKLSGANVELEGPRTGMTSGETNCTYSNGNAALYGQGETIKKMSLLPPDLDGFRLSEDTLAAIEMRPRGIMMRVSESSDGGATESPIDEYDSRPPGKIRTKIHPKRPTVKKSNIENIRPVRRTPPKPQLHSDISEILAKQDPRMMRQCTPEEPDMTSYILRREKSGLISKNASGSPPRPLLSQDTLRLGGPKF